MLKSLSPVAAAVAILLGVAAPVAAQDVTHSVEIQTRRHSRGGPGLGCEAVFAVGRLADSPAARQGFGGALVVYNTNAGERGMALKLTVLSGDRRLAPSQAALVAVADNGPEFFRTLDGEPEASVFVFQVQERSAAELAALSETGATRVSYRLSDGAEGAFDLDFKAVPDALPAWRTCLSSLPAPVGS